MLSKVLLIEDNPVIRRINQLYLNQLGCEVYLAENGQQALQMIQLKCDYIFLDISLPDCTGDYLITEIRRHIHNNNQTPIIVLTAQLDLAEHKFYMEAGATIVLTKQIILETFRKLLH